MSVLWQPIRVCHLGDVEAFTAFTELAKIDVLGVGRHQSTMWVMVISISRGDLDRTMTNQPESKTPVSAPEKSESEDSSVVALEQSDSEVVVETHTPEPTSECKDTMSSEPLMPLINADAPADVLGITDPLDAGAANAEEAVAGCAECPK